MMKIYGNGARLTATVLWLCSHGDLDEPLSPNKIRTECRTKWITSPGCTWNFLSFFMDERVIHMCNYFCTWPKCANNTLPCNIKQSSCIHSVFIEQPVRRTPVDKLLTSCSQ